MRISWIGIVICAVMLSACGGATQWYLNGHSENQFRMDEASCQQYALAGYTNSQGGYYAGYGAATGDSTVAGLGAALATMEYAQVTNKYQLCMRSYGYTIAR